MKHSLTRENGDFKEGVFSFLEKRKAKYAGVSHDNIVVKRAKELLLKSKL